MTSTTRRAAPRTPNGAIFALAEEKQGKLDGSIPFDPLIIRANAGDCVKLTLTSEMTDTKATDGFSKINLHVHHVQFDPQASDGVISGYSYEQSVRPYKLEDPQLTAAAPAGTNVLHLTSVAKFHQGAYLAAGLGTDWIEPAQIASIDAATKTITLAKPLTKDHANGEWAGVEFVQSHLVSRRRARQRVLPRPRRRPPHLAARHGRADPGGAQGLDLPRPEDRAPSCAPARSPTSTPPTRSSRASSPARSASSP